LLPSEIGEVYVRLHGWSDFTYHGMPDKRREGERDGLISLRDVVT
jgi:long-chain acyl-CoA synthetase